MLPNSNSKIELPDLKVVHLSGFKLTNSKPVTVVKEMLASEFHFDPSNIWNLSNRSHNIIEMVIVKASDPDLIIVLANNKFSLKLAADYDPCSPDRLESSEESLVKFRIHITREISRITRECEKVSSPKIKNIGLISGGL